LLHRIQFLICVCASAGALLAQSPALRQGEELFVVGRYE
jgi:hypothetical protein